MRQAGRTQVPDVPGPDPKKGIRSPIRFPGAVQSFRACHGERVRQRLRDYTVMDHPTPSPDDMEDLFLSCRYGDIDDVKSFIDRFGTAPVGEARDENGNNVLHMASANGHIGKSNRTEPSLPDKFEWWRAPHNTTLHYITLLHY